VKPGRHLVPGWYTLRKSAIFDLSKCMLDKKEEEAQMSVVGAIS